MMQISRYMFKIEARWIKDLGYVRGRGQHVIRDLLKLPEQWKIRIRYRDLNPNTVLQGEVTIDVFAQTDGDPTGPRHYCQLWIPYELEQETRPRWEPPHVVVDDTKYWYGRYISAENLIWGGSHWLYVDFKVGVSTTPPLRVVRDTMMPLFELYKDKLADGRTPSFIKVDAGYQCTGNGDEWVLAKEPRLDV